MFFNPILTIYSIVLTSAKGCVSSGALEHYVKSVGGKLHKDAGVGQDGALNGCHLQPSRHREDLEPEKEGLGVALGMPGQNQDRVASRCRGTQSVWTGAWEISGG